MKKMFVAVALAALSPQVGAAEFGVGVSAQSDDALIYVPIDVTPRFRLEPSLRFEEIHEDSLIQNPFSDPDSVRFEVRSYEIALGAFGVLALGESVRTYYGARLAYVASDSEARLLISDGAVLEEDVDSDGYRISPTLGFEYLVTDRFSIGGEAEWFYEDLDFDYPRSFVVRARPLAVESTGTNTRLILRFRF
jgi:hypothetical protein